MDFESARIKMVDNQIRTTDVTDLKILTAFLQVPRERFVPAQRQPLAYIDEDVPLGSGRFLMEPSPFAKLLQLALVRPGDTVLDIGSATGYSAAILARLAGRVVALDADAAMAEAARRQLSELGVENCEVVSGDMAKGHAAGAPYDVILIEGSVDAVPEALFAQLSVGGRLVAVEGRGNAAAARLHLKEENTLSQRFGFNCSIKPLPGFQKTAEFVF